jgi:hypothetical protein
VAYAFQIYFDFSGYSDMAIGLGLMLGFIFAKNDYRRGMKRFNQIFQLRRKRRFRLFAILEVAKNLR